MASFRGRLLGAAWCLGLMCNIALAASDFEPGIDISVEHEHQEFSNDSANANTVDIAPNLQYGHWDFSLDAPWISADANYVNNKFPSRVVTTCDKVSQYTNYALKHPHSRIAKILSACDAAGVVPSGDTVSGLSDVTAFAHYGMLLDDQGVWLLSVGAGYKFDNGDADNNLGSGTRDTLLETSLGASYGWFSGSVTGGYAFVDGGDITVDSSHYNYASLDLDVTPWRWLTLGCAVDYAQSYIATTADVTKVTAYVKFKPWQHVRFKIYTRDYGSAEGYPDREYGGSLSLVY